MKKTQLIDLFNTIKKSMVSFCAITVFVALGITMYSGLSFGSKSTKYNCENIAMNIGNMYDISIKSTFGLTKEEIEKVESIDGVDVIEGTKFAEGTVVAYDNNFYVAFESITSTINRFVQIEGELPKNEDEIAIMRPFSNNNNLSIGDFISLEKTNSLLKKTEFKITGIVSSPAYLLSYGYGSYDGVPFRTIIFTDEGAFKTNPIISYNNVYIKSDSLRDCSFGSDEYKDKCDTLEDKIDEVVKPIFNEKDDKYSSFLGINAFYAISNATMNASLMTYQIIQDCNNTIRYVVGIVFTFIAILVSYSAILRLVTEHSKELGMKKALGFTDKEITKSVMLYSLFAVFIGTLFAIGISYFVGYLYNIVFLGNLKMETVVVADYFTFAIMALIMDSSILITTYLSSRRTLKKQAIKLLQDESTVTYKKRFFTKGKLWERTPLFTRTAINGIFNDKKRVAGTVIGICSVSMLTIMALSIRGNMVCGINTQINDYYKFSSIVFIDNDVSTSKEEILSILEESGYRATPAYINQLSCTAPNGDSYFANIICPENMEDFKSFVRIEELKNYTSKKDLYDGIWMSNSYGFSNGYDSLSSLKMYDGSGREISFEPDGLYYQYCFNGEVIISNDKYNDFFDGDFVSNCIIVDSLNDSCLMIDEKLRNIDGYVYTWDFIGDVTIKTDMFFKMFNLIAILALSLSSIMSFLIVMNLLTMFLKEKKKEIIVLMINGYSKSSAKRWIYLDTIFLGVIAIILSIPLGTLLANVSIYSFVSASFYVHFGFDWMSCLIGIGATAVFVSLGLIKTLKEIDKLELKDISN